MKRLAFISSLMFLLLCSACMSPADYNVAIMDEVTEVDRVVSSSTPLLKLKNQDEAQSSFRKAKEEVEAALEKLNGMSAFRDDDALRQAAIAYIRFYNDLLSQDTETIDNAVVSEQEIGLKQKLYQEHSAFVKKYGLLAGAFEN